MEFKNAIFESGKSLKAKNRWLLMGYACLHAVVFAAIVVGIEPVFNVGSTTFAEWSKSIAPAVAGFFLTSFVCLVLLGLVPSHARDRLVHLRWTDSLPGSRAFTLHAERDPRINISALEEKYGLLPSDPAIQNQIWYRASLEHKNNIGVLDAHRSYLAARDLSTVSWIFAPLLPVISYTLSASMATSLKYGVGLLLVAVLLSLVTRVYGVRFVENVLAVDSNSAFDKKKDTPPTDVDIQ